MMTMMTVLGSLIITSVTHTQTYTMAETQLSNSNFQTTHSALDKIKHC